MDSGASISALPKEVGKGFPIIQDEHSGFEYLGAGEQKITDEGSRALQFIDENWTSKNLNHRVAKMRNPLVAASQTAGAGNLILMSEASSFVAPLSSRFGRELKKAIKNLERRFGLGDCTTLYERNGIYCFDAWVKPGPQKKGENERNTANAVSQDQVGERSPAASGGRVSTEGEKKEFEIAGHESKWQPVPKRKAATKRFMASHGHGCQDESCNHDGGYWSGLPGGFHAVRPLLGNDATDPPDRDRLL